MPTSQEQILNLAYEISRVDRRLQYTERRVRAIRAENFVNRFKVEDLGELGDVSTFLDFKEVAVPANPDSGWRRVFANTSTNKLSVRTSSGTTINLEYGDTEAIAAIEGEATLDLTGEVTIASGKSLTVKTDGSTGGVKFGSGGDVILYRGAANALYLGTGDSLKLVSGAFDLIHTSSEDDDHALEIDADAAGHGDVKALDIVYDTGAIIKGEDEAIILVDINEFDATGGEVFGLEVLSTDGGADAIYAIKAGAVVGPILQDSGDFANPNTATNDTPTANVDDMKDGSTGTNTTIFVLNTDYIIIGATNPFTEIEFNIETTANNPGIKPTFEYSKAGGAWSNPGDFSPIDGTNGFRNSGVIAWDAADLTDHAVHTSGGVPGDTYDIRIRRTHAVAGSVSLFYAKIAETVVYSWAADGDLSIRDITSAGDVTIVGSGKSLEVINFKFETSTELTIDGSGDVTRTQASHNIDTNGGAGTDNLDGIAGGADGMFLLIRPNNDGRTVVVRHNQNATATKNILLAGGDDATLDDIQDFLFLIYDSALDTNGAWVEISRSTETSAYTDVDAIAAVEGEATLALSGAVEITGILTIDVINEKTGAAGVTIETVILKDGLVDGIDIAARDHAQAHGPTDHTGFGNWKVIHTDGSGDQQEVAVGADGTVFTGTGTGAAPEFGAADDHSHTSQGGITTVGALASGSITSAFGSINIGASAFTTTGALGAGETTLADGASLNLQEAITFGGATTENIIEFPDNLADALSFEEGGTVYMTFVTTNGSEKIAFGKTIDVTGDIVVSGTVDGVDIAGRDHAKYTNVEAVNAVAAADDYLKNDANDETSGDLTVANLITAGNVDGVDVSALDSAVVKKADFNATTFLYATNDDTPQVKTPTEVMAILSAAAGAAFDWGGQDLANVGVLFLTEQAAAEADVPGKGQLWVKTGAPNELWWTDEDGTDTQLGVAGGAHAILSATHSDSVANAVTRGSLIYGNATPAWDELVIGAADTILASDNTDASWTGSPSLSGTLTVDAINEFTGAAGVTFEGVKALDSFLEFSEIAIPSAPAASKGRLFTPVLDENDSLTPGTDETGLFYRRNDGLMVKLSDDFPYSTAIRHVGQDDEPLFENSWVNFEGVPHLHMVSFTKDFLDCVWVTGVAKSGTIGANDIFDLPEGYWNTGGSLRWATISNAALGILDLISGSPEAPIGNNTYFSLSRMAFPETSRITWHDVGGGGEPAFENSWENFGAAWDTAAFAKDAIGRVWVKGLVKLGDDAAAVFTLPAGYRPAATILLPIAMSNNLIGRLDINAAGEVVTRIIGAGSNAWATITCVFTPDGVATWREIGGGGEPAFENNWVNFGAAHNTAAFYKDACGIVHIKGLVKDGTIGQTIFTLPVGYRPRGSEVVSSLSNAAIGRLDITSDGTVVAVAGNNAYFTIHYSFVAEQ